jgi:adenosylmethionine-8-amino-7-oxononanoate aminotransferase
MTREDIYQAFYSTDVRRGFLHSHSYTGNPLACRAALATLAIFEEDEVLVNNRLRADKITQALKPLAQHDKVKHFRQQGMIWAFDAVDATPDFSRRFFSTALEHELLMRPIGSTVYLMPPYILDDEQIDGLGKQMLAVFNHVMGA